MAVFDLSGLDRLTQRFRQLVNPDATPLMVSWMKIIDTDNLRGIMRGLDKDGNPMARVTYRPVGKPIKPSRKRGAFQPPGSALPTPAEYRRMIGPPLAPRGLGSRVITNLVLRFGRLDPSRWEAVGYWEGVVDRKGRPFLQYHFDGRGQKRRDLRGVRPDGVAKAEKAARAWMISEIRSNG